MSGNARPRRPSISSSCVCFALAVPRRTWSPASASASCRSAATHATAPDAARAIAIAIDIDDFEDDQFMHEVLMVDDDPSLYAPRRPRASVRLRS